MFWSKHKLNANQKQQITSAIHAAEKQTSGQIKVHVSYAKKEPNLDQSAKRCFEHLSLHQVKHRNGMILYLNPLLKKFSIYGDEAIHQKVGQIFWDRLIHEVRSAIQEKDIAHGIVHAVEKMGSALKEHFPKEE